MDLVIHYRLGKVMIDANTSSTEILDIAVPDNGSTTQKQFGNILYTG